MLLEGMNGKNIIFLSTATQTSLEGQTHQNHQHSDICLRGHSH